MLASVVPGTGQDIEHISCECSKQFSFIHRSKTSLYALQVPDVIRRGLRLSIGLAICNSLGFFLAHRMDSAPATPLSTYSSFSVSCPALLTVV